jgi:glycosyltransferase involved in cell wall biosynthesis
MPGFRRRVAFVTDILTPYSVAVHEALAELVDLVAIYCARSGTRGLDWEVGRLPYRHEIVGGPKLAKRSRDDADYQPDPRILRAIIRARPDAVISGGYSFPTLYSALYSRRRGVPLLIHGDGTAEYESPLSALQRCARRILVPASAGAVANSEPAARRFEETGFSADSVFRAPHSTNVVPLHAVARARRFSGREQFRVLATGRLIPRKGVDRLLHAFAAASQQSQGLSLRIVGTGPEGPRLRQLARALGAPIEFAGFVDQTGLPAEYAAADAYAFPTLADPFGVVLLEAAAAGLPIVASPLGGATEELIQDEVTGLVRHPDDHDAWVEALLRLTNDPALRERLGRAAYAVTAERTPQATARGYAEAVAIACARRARIRG